MVLSIEQQQINTTIDVFTPGTLTKNTMKLALTSVLVVLTAHVYAHVSLSTSVVSRIVACGLTTPSPWVEHNKSVKRKRGC